MVEDRAGESDGHRPDPLVAWSLATFDVVAFVLALVLAGHAAGLLADALGGLDTRSGLALFAFLWALVLAGSHWTLARAPIGTAGMGRLALYAFVAGALVGFGFVAGVLAAAAVAVGLDLRAFAFFLLVGGGAGVAVGGIVGLLFGLVNVACYRLGDRLASSDRTTPGRR